MTDSEQLKKDYEEYRMYTVAPCSFDKFVESRNYVKMRQEGKYPVSVDENRRQYLGGNVVYFIWDEERTKKTNQYPLDRGADHDE